MRAVHFGKRNSCYNCARLYSRDNLGSVQVSQGLLRWRLNFEEESCIIYKPRNYEEKLAQFARFPDISYATRLFIFASFYSWVSWFENTVTSTIEIVRETMKTGLKLVCFQRRSILPVERQKDFISNLYWTTRCIRFS